MARINKIIDENSTASRLSAKRVRDRKLAASVVVGLLLALVIGAASHLYLSSYHRGLLTVSERGAGQGAVISPSPPAFGPEFLSSLPHNQLFRLFGPAAPAVGAASGPDEREAARLYKFAADKGNSDAQRKLASFYEFGRGGLPQDNDQAARLYKLSADQGNAAAQLELGVVYELGRIGTQKNDEQAQRYYQLAADQGNPQAQYALGRFYEFGRGHLSKDYRMAALWYRRAADQGQVDASYRLANLLSNDEDGDTGAQLPFIGQVGFPWRLVIAVLAISAIICGAGFWLYNHHRLVKLSYTLVSKDNTQPAGGSSPQVFVSYSRADSDVVDQLVAQIKQLGYTVWIDREETSSQRFAATIVAGIRKARLVALMCSRHSVTSDQVVREVYVAGDCKKPFVIFQLDSTQFPDEFLYFLSGYPRISTTNLDTARLRSQIEKAIV
jgi:TPR repeat protein